MKSFEIAKQFKVGDTAGVWTINLKSFEIHYANTDKFWNLKNKKIYISNLVWTINLKSFEIQF